MAQNYVDGLNFRTGRDGKTNTQGSVVNSSVGNIEEMAANYVKNLCAIDNNIESVRNQIE